MDRSDYRNLKHFADVRSRIGIPQKSTSIRESLSASPAFQQCALKLATLNKEVVLIHVRRGDIAVANLNSLSDIELADHDPKDNDKAIYALDGNLSTQTEILSSPHRYRYVEAEKYYLALQRFLDKKEPSDYFVVLVSDGYDRLIRRIAQSSEIRLNCTTQELNKYFLSELSDLASRADICVIGENEDSLLETVTYTMMAKVIIHGPSSMAVNLKSSIGNGEIFTSLLAS